MPFIYHSSEKSKILTVWINLTENVCVSFVGGKGGGLNVYPPKVNNLPLFSPNRPTGPILSSNHDVRPFVVCCVLSPSHAIII